jgi:hypothetical protein
MNTELALFALFVALQLADIWTTLRFLKNKTGHEANPVMAYLFEKFGVIQSLCVVKSAAVAIAWFLQTEIMVIGVLCAFYAYIAINNYRIGSGK